MCGICGIVGDADERLVRCMCRTIAHRGPDGEGIASFLEESGKPPATLGHRRLSIIDPSERGAQPMSCVDARYYITYNGELYNFRELRRELEAEGYRFRSDCDTEVLLAMYARHGEEMLSRLNGIFAFAIWDSERGELFLARDRLGVKPLYYAEQAGTLLFASEVKALLEALPRPRMREDVVPDFLTFLWVPDPDTMFGGIWSLPAGHCGTFAGGRLRVRKYWDMTYEPEYLPEAEWVSRVREAVLGSVRRQMVSDVPLGSFLSGGIDSTAIVAAMAGATDRPVTAYSIGFSPEDLPYEIAPDDARYARLVADQFDVDLHPEILRADIVELLPKLVWHMDEPVADPAAITTYLICSAASQRLKVVLSGMGGDEVFAGYPRYLAARFGRLADVVPKPARSAFRRGIEGRLTLGRPGRLRGPRRNLLKLLRGIDLSPDERYLAYRAYYRDEELERVLSPELRSSLNGHDPFALHRSFLSQAADQHWLNRFLYLDLKTFLPCLNLTYTDKMSMAASVEVRVPLLDDEIIALSGRLPPSLKLRRMTRKYAFKRSMEGLIPSEVIWRPKAGFGAPIRAWLVGELKPMIDDLLSPSSVAARGLLDPAEVQTLIRDNDAGRADNALRIWALLTLELWQRTFIDREPRDSAPAIPSLTLE
jgi:asparagine synthase (glutamine-hydrolysing)